MIQEVGFLTTNYEKDGLASVETMQVANELVQAEDPLCLDNEIGEIKVAISIRDEGLLRSVIEQSTFLATGMNSFSLPAKIAVLRDLGFLVAAYHSIATEPKIGLETTDVLLKLGHDLKMPPRDTLYTYSIWNPLSVRQRSFTDSTEESAFISSIKTWSNSLHAGLLDLVAIRSSEFNIIEEKTSSLTENFKQMQQAMVEVRRCITSEWFYLTLQPFFRNFSIGAEIYEPPSGAHMNLLLMDHLLWGADSTNSVYIDYRDHNVAYLPESYKSLILGDQLPSIYTLLSARIQTGNTLPAHVLSTLLEISTIIVSFRRVHLALAREMLSIKFPEGIPLDNKEILKLETLINGVGQIRNLIKQEILW